MPSLNLDELIRTLLARQVGTRDMHRANHVADAAMVKDRAAATVPFRKEIDWRSWVRATPRTEAPFSADWRSFLCRALP